MTFIVAEIGINHNGSLELATKMVEEAAQSGVDAVKLQNYDVDDFITDKSLTYTYYSQGLKITESQYEMFSRYQVDTPFLRHISKVCESCNIEFLSTPTSAAGVDILKRLGCKYIKNGSDFLSNHALINYMAASGMHVVLSTGMADKNMIDSAFNLFDFNNCKNLTLLHCTSSYPTTDDNVNMNRFLSLKQSYPCHIGFSDHTQGSFAAVASSILGASFIEKHYTLDHTLPGPDHWFSINPKELKNYVADIRRAARIMGNAEIVPSVSEMDSMQAAQISLVYSQSLSKGTILLPEMTSCSRPGNGLSPSRLSSIVGKTLCVDVKPQMQISLSDFNDVKL